MKRAVFVAAAGASAMLGSAAPARAELSAGTSAPLFQAQASLGGKVFPFELSAALKRGPVVLYFYPAAFTPGCTIEAHDFADNIGAYKALGATVIGISGDGVEKLQKFSVSECRSKFPVAADPSLAIAKRYNAVLINVYANRTSYVIAPDGKIVYAYTSLDPSKHVANTLAALHRLSAPAPHAT